MSTTYAQKFSTIPKVSEKKGAFILDESSQSKCLQRKIDLINNTVRREDISSNNFIVQRSVKRYFNSRRKYSRNHRAREKNHSRSYMYFAKIDYRNPYTDNFKDRHLGNSIIDALEKSAERLSKNPDIFKNHVILPKTGLKFKLAKE